MKGSKLRCKMSCVCVCEYSPLGDLIAVGMLQSHQGHTREEAAVLCPFWTSLTPLPRSFFLLHLFLSLCFFPLPLTLCVSISPYLNHFLPFFIFLLPRMPPWSEVLSHLLHPSCVCLSLVPVFLAGHISPLHYLTNSKQSSQLKPLYLCLSGPVFFLVPLHYSPLFFLSLLAYPLLLILSTVSHSPVLMRPNLCLHLHLSFYFRLSLPNVSLSSCSFTFTCLPCFVFFSLFHPLSLFQTQSYILTESQYHLFDILL